MMIGSKRSKREVGNGVRGYVIYLQLFCGSIGSYFNFGHFRPEDMTLLPKMELISYKITFYHFQTLSSGKTSAYLSVLIAYLHQYL